MRKLKRVFAVVAVLAVALVVAVYAILENLDLEYVRGLAQDKVREATGRELVIAGPIDLVVSLSPIIALEDVSFANAPWASRPKMASMKRFELQVALLPLLTGDIVVERLILVAPDILLETDDKGEGNWVLSPVESKVEEVSGAGGSAKSGVVPTIDLLTLEDAKLAFHSGATDNTYSLFLERLHAEAEGSARSLSVTGKGNLDGAEFELTGKLGALKTLAAGTPYPVDIELKLGKASLSLSGSIDDDHRNLGLELAVSAALPSLAALSPLLGTSLPPLGPIEVSAKVTTIEGGYGVNQLTLKISDSDLAGNADLFLGKGRPRITGKFVSKLLRAEDFSDAEASAGDGGGGGKDSPYLIPSDPLPFDSLQLLDAKLSLQVDRLQLSEKLDLKDLDLGFDLQAGRLIVDPMKAGLAEGSLVGRAEVRGDQQPAEIVSKFEGKDIKFGQLARDTGVDDSLSGELDLAFDLKGRGDSPHAIASTLDGRAEVFSEGGEIQSRTLKIFAVGLGSILGPLFGGKSDAKVNCMVARFDLKQGVAKSRALLFDSEVVTLAGEGKVDLRDEKLKLHFSTATRSLSLASLAVPFTVGGTLKAPKITANPIAAATGAAKTVAEGAANTAKSIVGTLERLVGKEGSGGDDRDACHKALADAGKAVAEPATGGDSKTTTQETKEPQKKSSDSLDGALDNLKSDFKKLFGD
jgi:uncharacterized protein involved in outer membrane biogenesis